MNYNRINLIYCWTILQTWCPNRVWINHNYIQNNQNQWLYQNSLPLKSKNWVVSLMLKSLCLCHIAYVMGCDQNLHELSMNVISHFIVYVKGKCCDWQFSLFYWFRVKTMQMFAWLHVKSLKLQELDVNTNFIIQNWTETWFCEILSIAFQREFSVSMNSLTHHYLYTTIQVASFKVFTIFNLTLLK